MALISKKRVWAMIAAVAVLAVIVLGVRMIGVKHLGYDTRPIATVSYACDEGKTITASFYRGESQPPAAPGMPPTPGGRAFVVLGDGRTFMLPQTLSADGMRYANADESFIFWSKGDGALVLENNEQTYIGCVRIAKDPGSLPYVYAKGSEGFSIRLPSLTASTSKDVQSAYTLDESYRYQEFGSGKDIGGVKFTIPGDVSAGTNLGSDSYISVEEIPRTQVCSASLFLPESVNEREVTDGDTTYSVASSTGAGAGNRYEETVYAIPGTNPCFAVRYFIHYGVFENYAPGMVHQFDKEALLAQFDAIRRTLIIVQ